MQYKIGTVSVTNGSAIVTGTGTLWLANLVAGALFTVQGDNVTYTIASVDADLQITLNANYGGVTGSGKTYAAHRDFTSGGIPLLSNNDIETGTIFSRAMSQIQDLINSVFTGLSNFSVLNVSDNSVGNVSRYVAVTASGSTGAEDGINTWTKLATINIGAIAYRAAHIRLLLCDGYTGGSGTSCEIDVRAYQDTVISIGSRVHITDCTSTAFFSTSFKLIANASAAGSDIELWVKKRFDYGKYTVTELSRQFAASDASVTYYSNLPWQSAEPVGSALNVRSVWGGSGAYTPTCVNGWATGSVRYSKSVSGIVAVSLYITTVTGTTTDGTIITTIPPEYLPNSALGSVGFTLRSSTGGANGGSILINVSTGEVKIYNYISGGALLGQVSYREGI